MDSVQELIQGVGQAQMNGNSQTIASPSPPTAPRRTKMVFVYSDEDDVEGDKASTALNGMAEIPCDTHAIPLSEDVLAELRADAHAIDAQLNETSDGASADDNAEGLFFHEDILSGLGAAASAPGLTSSLRHHSADGAPSGGMRVREVDAPALWEGALAPPSTTDDYNAAVEMPALLRRGLPAATFVLESRRKRFRDAEGDHASPVVRSGTAAANTSSATAAGGEPMASAVGVEESEAVEAEEVEDFDVQPIFEEDGKTVRALQTRGGYVLTLDERDLLENADDGDEEGEEGAVEGSDTAVQHADVDEAAEVKDGDAMANEIAATDDVEAQDDWGDFLDDDEEDDEEEEEMDEAIVVAVVEQLVRCCEADDVDPQLSIEVGRFTAAAKPLLKDLTDEVISPKEFGQKIDRDLRRFQRIYRSVNRPRDAPIVIDGVLMDM